MGPDKEQEEAFAGQRLEAESDAQVATETVPPTPVGRCPSCGRDKVNS